VAVEGRNLFSGIGSATWITSEILAMSRPTSKSIIEFSFGSQLKASGVTAIFNTQEPGEHPYCGEKLPKSRNFSYEALAFEDTGISVYFVGWADFGVPSFDFLLSAVRMACKILDAGERIAVHCHAGFGRTGILIACILVYHDGISAETSISFVRSRRAPSIQNKRQQAFVHEFASRCQKLRISTSPDERPSPTPVHFEEES
jgi:hypothetical protein